MIVWVASSLVFCLDKCMQTHSWCVSWAESNRFHLNRCSWILRVVWLFRLQMMRRKIDSCSPCWDHLENKWNCIGERSCSNSFCWRRADCDCIESSECNCWAPHSPNEYNRICWLTISSYLKFNVFQLKIKIFRVCVNLR